MPVQLPGVTPFRDKKQDSKYLPSNAKRFKRPKTMILSILSTPLHPIGFLYFSKMDKLQHTSIVCPYKSEDEKKKLGKQKQKIHESVSIDKRWPEKAARHTDPTKS